MQISKLIMPFLYLKRASESMHMRITNFACNIGICVFGFVYEFKSLMTVMDDNSDSSTAKALIEY